MAGIYIKNMSMPQGDQLVVVTSDGVALLINEELITLERSKAVPVLNHGRLIDADEIHYTGEYGGTRVTTKSLIDFMPTIISADAEK